MSTESDVRTGVHYGFAVAAVACGALPPPADGFCEAAVAIGRALDALGEWLTDAFRDTYHPTMSDSEAWLILSRIHPWLAMSDIDRSDDPNHGSMMMRYWMVTSGETPKGKKGNNGLLHNPHLQIGEYNFNCENPYQCNDDPDEPMSSMVVMQDVMNRQQKWVASGGGKNLKALPMMVPTLRRHPAEAQIILNAIRKYPKPFIAQMGFPEIFGERESAPRADSRDEAHRGRRRAGPRASARENLRRRPHGTPGDQRPVFEPAARDGLPLHVRQEVGQVDEDFQPSSSRR